MIEHHIQKNIIERLSYAKVLRFSDLKPDDLESNAFMYHLNQLIKSQYALKTENGYTLSPQGLTYVDGLSFTNAQPRKQPKILGVLVLKNAKGQYILAKRKLQPFIETMLFPGGKQHFGESPEEHIRRELMEQFELDRPATRRGLVDQRTYIDGVLVTHVLAHIYEIEFEGEVPKENHKFIYSWENVSRDLALYPGAYELFEALESSRELFFLSLDVKTD